METQYPSLSARIQSIFIDTLFLMMMIVLVSSILGMFSYVPDWVHAALFVAIFIAYEPLCLTFGCTVGNYFKRIRVKRYNDLNRKINFGQAMVRYMVKFCLGWLSFLTIHSNSSKRAIHDLACGSVMIYWPPVSLLTADVVTYHDN